MPSQHFTFSNISKSAGGNVIAVAAYNEREKKFDVLENRMKYPHASKADHIETVMLLTPGAPDTYNKSENMWNDLNRIELDRIAKKILMPLPKELSYEQQRELAIQFVEENFVDKGHPAQISFHGEKHKNNNTHAHVLIADRCLTRGKWAEKKSETQYYLRGTVETDEKGKITNEPVILTLEDKVDTPKLKRGKLQYDKEGNIICTKGWQQLQYDSNGNLKMDELGRPVLIDIREPYYIPGTKEIKLSKNGKKLKPQWKKNTVKVSDLDFVGNIAHYRKQWEIAQNKAFEKYNIMDQNQKLLQVDLRSYKEQDAHLLEELKRIATRHIGYGYKSDISQQFNEAAQQHNAMVQGLKNLNQKMVGEKENLKNVEKEIAAYKSEKLKDPKSRLEQVNKRTSQPETLKQCEIPVYSNTSKISIAKATGTGVITTVTNITRLIQNKAVTSTSSNKNTRLHISTNNRDITETERIRREYFADDLDISDELQDPRPKINALQELTNVLTHSQTIHKEKHDNQEDNRVGDSAFSTTKQQQTETENKDRISVDMRRKAEQLEKEKAAEKKYKIKKEERIAIVDALRADFISWRCAAYRESAKEKNLLYAKWEKEVQQTYNKLDQLNDNRSWWQRFRHKVYTISEKKQNELDQWYNEFKNAKAMLNTKFPEIAKCRKYREDETKIRHYYEQRQINLLIADAIKLGYPDTQGIILQYKKAQSEERAAYRIYASYLDDPANPASGQISTPTTQQVLATINEQKSATQRITTNDHASIPSHQNPKRIVSRKSDNCTKEKTTIRGDHRKG